MVICFARCNDYYAGVLFYVTFLPSIVRRYASLIRHATLQMVTSNFPTYLYLICFPSIVVSLYGVNRPCKINHELFWTEERDYIFGLLFCFLLLKSIILSTNAHTKGGLLVKVGYISTICFTFLHFRCLMKTNYIANFMFS